MHSLVNITFEKFTGLEINLMQDSLSLKELCHSARAKRGIILLVEMLSPSMFSHMILRPSNAYRSAATKRCWANRFIEAILALGA